MASNTTTSIQSFIHQNHSLRLPASQISSYTGLHPYTSLPKFLLDLIYQGSIGKLLLLQDLHHLNLTLQSEEELLTEISKKASRETKRALEKIQATKAQTVEKADELKKNVVKEARNSGKLTRRELKLLEEGTRSMVDTKFGVNHETDALDLFERQIGWEVRDRNAQIRQWSFVKVDGDDWDGGRLETVVPMGDAEVCSRERSSMGSSSGSDLESNANETKSERKRKRKRMSQHQQQPFFSILGAVDGIRDELYHNDTTSDDDNDPWTLRQVIIECKHRMKRFLLPPPLYDQIQAAVYCFMYKVNHAEIIQVVRREQKTNDSNAEKQDKQQNTSNQGSTNSNGNNRFNSSNTTSNINITSTRISLDDPLLHHRENFHTIILPRLRSFVEVVYSIRCNEIKRHLLLQYLANDREKDAWEILLEECVWLKDCDIAYGKLLKEEQ